MEGKDQLSKRRFLYFRCFSDIEVNFNSNLTVIAGINGSGKSTVLEAAAIAAGTLSFAMDGLTNYGIKKK
ncbi:MAG: AAA family ATPase [Hungatella sp.]|nr:AAA family ATPase [Hungatella sp.]